MSRDDFIVTFPQLLLNFFGYQIDCRVKIVLMILGEYVRTLKINMHGAFEFVFRQADMIPFQIHPGFQRPSIHVLEFINTNTHMFLNGFGNFNIVGIKNKLHRVEACSN